MMTLRQFSAEPSTISTITSWYIADLSKAQGKQEEKPLLKDRNEEGFGATVTIWRKKG